MRRLFPYTIAIALAAVLAASPLLAKSVEFTLSQDSRVNNTELKAGTYKLELKSDSEAVIYNSHSKDPVAKASVTVKPLKGGSKQVSVVRDAEGNILEIRTKEQVVVFVR